MNLELPTHPDAERLVLGRMMNSINCVNAVFENLEEADFFLPEHRSIYKAAYALFSKDRAIDATAIMAELEKNYPEHANMHTVFGMQQYSFGMTNDFMQFIEIIRDYSIYRKTMLFSRDMIETASLKKLSCDEIKDKFLSDSEVIFKQLNETKLQNIKEVYESEFKESGKNFLQYVEWKQEQKTLGLNTISGYLTGYKLLDDCLEGINKKHYIIIGARAGVGKTTFVLNLMKRFMHRNLKVGFFSLEMSKDMVAEKYACLCAGIDQKKLSRGLLTPEDYQNLVVSIKNIDDFMVIDDQPNLKVSQLAARAKRMVLAHGVKILFIDYLSEVKGEGRFTNKQEEIQAVSKGLRAIAKNLNIPVICIAQLNRENEKSGREPIKSDLRESGQIEADAYSIILLHRPESEGDKNQPGKMIVRVVKNRLGRESDFEYSFNGNTGEIEEVGYKNKNHGATNNVNDPYNFLVKNEE